MLVQCRKCEKLKNDKELVQIKMFDATINKDVEKNWCQDCIERYNARKEVDSIPLLRRIFKK